MSKRQEIRTSMHSNLVYRLTEYFDLCDLAQSWRDDRETYVQIAGRDRIFSTLAEVESYRDAAAANLRGYCNVLRHPCP
jgi:hypothetical protein